MSNEWNDTKAILSELEQIFNRDDDVKDMLDIHKMQKEISIHSQQRLKDAKEIIKTMAAQVTKKEAEIAAPSQADHTAALKKLSEKENYQNQLDNILTQIDTKRQIITKLSNSISTLQERTNEFTLTQHMADSRTSYAISLYQKMSNIHWDYNNSKGGHLHGYVNNDRKKEVKQFDLNIENMSNFEVANSLWEMIGKTVTD